MLQHYSVLVEAAFERFIDTNTRAACLNRLEIRTKNEEKEWNRMWDNFFTELVKDENDELGRALTVAKKQTEKASRRVKTRGSNSQNQT